MPAGIIDRSGVLDRLNGARLDIGCGRHKVAPDCIGIDVLAEPGVDLVGDALDVLAQIGEGVIDAVHCSHFLEHVSDLERILSEITRVLRPGGTLTVTVPHAANPFYWSDPTHRQPFALYTFSYLAQDDVFERAVPRYYAERRLRLVSAYIGFRADQSAGYPVRYRVMKAIERLVNRSPRAQEFYEANLSQILPCFEIRFELEKMG